jgi:NTP pyrophosphatase (non-canonical NTP hydrolase)
MVRSSPTARHRFATGYTQTDTDGEDHRCSCRIFLPGDLSLDNSSPVCLSTGDKLGSIGRRNLDVQSIDATRCQCDNRQASSRIREKLGIQGLIPNHVSRLLLQSHCQLSPLMNESTSSLTIAEAQQRVDDWIKTIGVRYFSELTNLAQLVEEVGEVARIISRTYGDQSFKKSDEGKSLGDELADVLFVTICLANQTGIDLTDALERNLAKKTQRDATRHQGNEKLTSPEGGK